MPHGGRQKENMAYKLTAYGKLLRYLERLRVGGVILAGDFNVAHKELDLARPKQNQNNTMFTTEEREQLDGIIDLGLVDSFRQFNQEGGSYTWWPYSAVARDRHLGWRIDYVFVSKSFQSTLKRAFILPEVPGSDHCPAGIELEHVS